ncbi:MAG TPA: TonB-dependent receptor, partial [Ohtaekwangia sp.]|nr:TonB-dependent receptor [Ohtaekwangia sp.]
MQKTLRGFFSLTGMLLMFIPMAFAQNGSVKGTVQDDETGDVVVGASVMLKGTTVGTTTDLEGNFLLEAVPVGTQTLSISFIGYNARDIRVNVSAEKISAAGVIRIGSQAIGLEEVSVIASVAIDRKTPVAVSTVKGAMIEARVGNQEFPEILRSTPSVYVTKQGGGFGDSRINVRGFDQRNTAVMINGIPVNDMENGWVYWSNWAGLTDVTSSLQIQRGLSASKLAVSSVGGNINIVTNATQMERGGSVSLAVGNDGYLKYGAVFSSGLSEKGWAFTLQATRTVGDGYVDGTAFSAYSYFASIAKKINEKHSLHLTALGAPQWHNQRTLGAFDGVTIETFEEKGIRYNPQWGEKSGDEFSWQKNFYHKPKIFINHYWSISDRTELATSAYVSIGRGGGTGDLGRINGAFRTSPQFRNEEGTVRWDDIINWNTGGSVPDFGADNVPWDDGGGFNGSYVGVNSNPGSGFIRRSSMNEHDWYGILSTLTHEIDDSFTLTGGLDARYYKGMHYRRVENLLGLAAFFDDDDINNPVKYVTGEGNDGDKIDYYNDGLVKWLGLFAQLEYSKDNLSAFVSGSYSNQSFQRIDYFLYEPAEQASDWEAFSGGTIKAGVNYNISENHNV